MKSLKNNKFFWVFVSLMVIEAVIIIITLRTVFGAVAVATEISEELLVNQTPRVNNEKLDQAIELNVNSKNWALDLQL